MEDYRIDFKCPRCKKIVSLGSDWAFELNEVLYCPACEYPAFKLVAAYSESPYQQACLTPLALDGGDSAASEQFPTPEVLSTLQGESTPAHRK
jgi:hypothetical protein